MLAEGNPFEKIGGAHSQEPVEKPPGGQKKHSNPSAPGKIMGKALQNLMCLCSSVNCSKRRLRGKGRTQQPYSNESINVLDYGYSSSGNYWSDYAGVDAKSSPD